MNLKGLLTGIALLATTGAVGCNNTDNTIPEKHYNPYQWNATNHHETWDEEGNLESSNSENVKYGSIIRTGGETGSPDERINAGNDKFLREKGIKEELAMIYRNNGSVITIESESNLETSENINNNEFTPGKSIIKIDTKYNMENINSKIYYAFIDTATSDTLLTYNVEMDRERIRKAF